MSFYVTVRGSGKFILAAGPFNRHGDAQRMVGPVRAVVGARFPKESAWVSFGERIAILSDNVPQGRWVTGDTADPVGYVRRHDTALTTPTPSRSVAT